MIRNKIFLVIAILIGLLSVNSCDFFRKIAGRPTSKEIEEKAELIERELIEREQKAEKERLDSIKLAQQKIADSIAVMDSLKQMNGSMRNPAKLGGLSTSQLDKKYYIVIGAFRQKSNAELLSSNVEKAGYPSTIISFRNGYNAVGVCPSNSLPDTYRKLRSLQQEKFCPADAWILVNE